MPWDPLSAWPNERRWVWATLAAWVCLLRGPAFIDIFRVPRAFVPDFFQEYASARNHFEGLPIYASHLVTIERYLGRPMDQGPPLVVVNAHPPTAVLLGLPFAGLDFDRAFLFWNLASLPMLAAGLWLVKHGLRIPSSAWSLPPLIALLLLCGPLWQQIHLGQLNLILLPLVTGAWAAERSGRPRLAGGLLGVATAIKLFPGFLLVYYALRRRWDVVAAGLIALAALTGLTAAVLGVEPYRAYVRDVLPETRWFRVGWNNASLSGFWSKLFDPEPDRDRLVSRSEPLWYSPMLASATTWLSTAVVVALLARSVRRVGSRAEGDRAFGLAATAMLLVSPIAWEHYFLLLLVPLAVLWEGPPRSAHGRTALLVITIALWTSPIVAWVAFGLGGRVARPAQSLTVLSYQTYALLALFGLMVIGLRRERGTGSVGRSEPAGSSLADAGGVSDNRGGVRDSTESGAPIVSAGPGGRAGDVTRTDTNRTE